MRPPAAAPRVPSANSFPTPINIALSAFGMDFLREVPRRMRHAGTPPNLGLVESSYL